MRGMTLALCLALLAGSAAAQSVAIDTQNQTIMPGMRALAVHVGGRVKVDPLAAPMPAGAMSYVHQWPGVYFEAAFAGDSVVLKFDDSFNEYRLLIDDLTPIALGQPGRSEVTVSALAAGPHRLRLEKVTESIGQVGAFDGFYIAPNETPLPANGRARQIEFIGASGETGYGVRSAVRPCTQEVVRLTSDTQNAYAALTAKHYDADYQINAISGRGMVRNIVNIVPDLTIPLVYPYTLLDKTVPYADAGWQPQIVVLSLGGNDFNGAVQPGEKWKDGEELAADFAKGYVDFVLRLHKRYPKAAFLIRWMDTSNSSDLSFVHGFNGARQSVLKAARKAGIKKIEFLLTDFDQDRTACHGHSSLGDHQKLTAWLTATIDAHPDYWQGR